MFKVVFFLTSVLMFSNNNAKIKSMTSTFENTKNLDDFTITGFNTEEAKSMNRMFFKSGLSLVILSGIDT